MLHPIVTFDTVLDCTGPKWPQMTSSHTGTLSIKVFVCGSGRAPPSFAGLWYITRLLLRVTHSTSPPGTDTQFNWLHRSSPLLLCCVDNSSVIIQSKFKRGAESLSVCFCLLLRQKQCACLIWCAHRRSSGFIAILSLD